MSELETIHCHLTITDKLSWAWEVFVLFIVATHGKRNGKREKEKEKGSITIFWCFFVYHGDTTEISGDLTCSKKKVKAYGLICSTPSFSLAYSLFFFILSFGMFRFVHLTLHAIVYCKLGFSLHLYIITWIRACMVRVYEHGWIESVVAYLHGVV